MLDSKNLVDPMNNFRIEFVKATPFHNKGKLSMIGATLQMSRPTENLD